MQLPDVTRSVRVSRDLLGEKIAKQLRQQILKGQLKNGSRLVEDTLAADFGTSRGPVRHAFILLAREGLLTSAPGKGAYVKGVTQESIRSLYGIRRVLENYAVELAIERATDQQLQELREICAEQEEAARTGNRIDYVRLDGAIHRQIWKLSGNEYVINLLEHILPPSMVLMELNAELYTDWVSNAARHRHLVEMLALRNVDAAKAGIQDMLERWLSVALSGLNPHKSS